MVISRWVLKIKGDVERQPGEKDQAEKAIGDRNEAVGNFWFLERIFYEQSASSSRRLSGYAFSSPWLPLQTHLACCMAIPVLRLAALPLVDLYSTHVAVIIEDYGLLLLLENVLLAVRLLPGRIGGR
jgi:hypothetical protein